MEIQQLGIIMGAFALFGGAAAFVMMPANGQKMVHARSKKLVMKYSRHESVKIAAQSSLKKKQLDKFGGSSSFIQMPSISRLREKLDRTGRDISLMRYLVWSVITLVIAFIIFKTGFGINFLVSTMLAFFMALMVPHFMVNRWINKRMKKFMLLLPDGIDLIVRGLRSGLPVSESINVIADEIEDPVKTVFAEIGQSVRIGVPFEDALMKAARKLDLNEFNFFVISIALQRETGGNLAEILENLSSTIRARIMMKLKVKAITSEARASAYIVGALPFVVAIVLSIIQPGYFDPFFADVRGNIAGGCAVLSFLIGVGSMMKMAKLKI